MTTHLQRTVDTEAVEAPAEDLQKMAQEHLILHFTSAAAYQDQPPTVMDRGEHCWLTDTQGNRHLDALAGLFCVNIGYSYGEEIGEAVKRQLSQLPYYSNWGAAQPPSIRLAAKIAELAPGPLNRVFLTTGGAESNEAAVKLIRQYHQARGEHSRTKFIARRVAYHGTSHGALSINGFTAYRKRFEPLMPGVRHVSNTKRYLRPAGESEEQFTSLLLDEMESLIVQEGADTVAGVFIEPLQNAGGSLTPPRGYAEGVRELCDKYGILLVADEVICGFGRLGEWFGSTRYGIRPDVLTFAKGASSAYAPIGGMITTDAVIDTVLSGPDKMFLHGVTFGGHPAACAAALANIAIMEREDIIGHVRRTEPYFRGKLEELLDFPLVGDVRGDGFHYSLELVTDKDAREWTAEVSPNDFVSRHLAPAIAAAGVICRAAVDHVGTPIVQFSPPLVMGVEEIDWMVDRLKTVLQEVAAFA
ncbi:aspartate aminotransferase family protein [Mycolicibacterium goodii]|uniref:aspartate aminotransferase family protein n=1 Tax=Mycolicibacterium goodii TaxID=134601 RepID=UPI001BDC777A|nr:aspartate aminotransferase family protein [Mycolicibacterium goodii]MBU8819656.1 aspartate aminotransferase family protein [Mycolicibacterium goodii]MBU8833961.1 aspartate aminotransferase family protein [Mycolicibacterium goodii]